MCQPPKGCVIIDLQGLTTRSNYVSVFFTGTPPQHLYEVHYDNGDWKLYDRGSYANITLYTHESPQKY